jgi:hypothetical protein
MRLAAAIAGALALSGCGAIGGLVGGVSSPITDLSGQVRGNAAEVDGIRFRTRLTMDGDDRRLFRTATRGAARAPSAAAEAGRVEAIGYCLRTFCGGEIDWVVGPDAIEGRAALAENGALVLRGRCIAR